MKYICSLFLLITYHSATAIAGTHHDLADFREMRRMQLDTDTVVRKQSVSVGMSYGSDASFFGRTSLVKFPYFTADAIYNTKSGFFMYGSLWKVSGSVPKVDEFDAGGGYNFRFKKFSGNVSYTHFFIDDNARVIKSASSNDFEIKNAFDWKFVKSSISADYLFGKASDIFLSFNLSKYFESSFSIFDNTDYLSFNPSVNFIFGTQNFVEHYSNTQRYNRDLVDGYTYIADENQTAGPNRVFNPLNYSLKLPLAYNRAHYTFEASWKYSIPVNVEGPNLHQNNTFFNLTFYYVFY